MCTVLLGKDCRTSHHELQKFGDESKENLSVENYSIEN